MVRSGKILMTFGIEKCKRMTKIKHQKEPNQRSDGSENKTKQKIHAAKVVFNDSASFFCSVTFTTAPSFLKTDALFA